MLKHVKKKAILFGAAAVLVLVGAVYSKNNADALWVGMGDANFDGYVNEADVNVFQRYLAGRSGESIERYVCDMDDDNKLDVFDLIYLKRLVAYGVYPGENPAVTLSSATTAVTTTTTTVTTTLSQQEIAEVKAGEILKLVNETRAEVGAESLVLDDKLCELAMIRAEEIVEEWGHTRPDGNNWSQILIENNVVFNARGENIAAGNEASKDTMNQWINSTGHYNNIINPEFGKLGVGYVYVPGSRYGHYWVQLFTN